jgi:hypothetical protein
VKPTLIVLPGVLKKNYEYRKTIAAENFYLLGWSGTKFTITEATYWLIVPALDNRWWWWW